MKLLRLLALPAVLVAIAGCGSSSSSSSAGSASGAASSSATSSAPASSSTAATSSTSASSTPASGGAAPSAGGAVKVTMKSLAFNPTSVTAKVGQTVEWTNDDGPPHNVTYVSGPKFTSSGTLNTGAKFSLKLTQAGTIHYFCSIHPFMKATIVVSK
jgi:plastocyanin